MRLTKNFTLTELTKTNTGLPNEPNCEEVGRLRELCEKVLQPLRDLYGNPIIVNSGFRSQEVNRKVGGVPNSQHRYGEAVDITGGNKKENEVLFNLIFFNLEFDQLIDERDFSWIHVSYTTRKPNRKQILKL